MTGPFRAGVLALTVLLAAGTGAPAADVGASPFAVGASVGSNSSSRIRATVTRNVNGKAVTLPAAAVPLLVPGDVVDMTFPDYTRPPAQANYHVNVAFITEVAPLHWLFPRSGPGDRLFSNDRGHRRTQAAELHFTYGEGGRLGIPVFVIVPEDAKTRGMDGVRDYVGAHPTDFKNMSESANDAVARYDWFRDFLRSLGTGALDPVSGQQRVEDIAASLGASPASVDACYTSGAPQPEIANCIQTTLLSVQYQTNIDAPTAAQFFGGVAGAASPTQFALYLEPVLGIWQILSRLGHQEYEYLPAALNLTAPAPGGRFGEQLLMGAKVPTLRPPAARSSVLFFTIGNAREAQQPPQVVSDANALGSCAQGDRVALPLHVDRTSPYLHDAAVVVTPDRGTPFTIPLDPRELAAPVVARARLDPTGVGESIRLSARFGFAPLAHAGSLLGRIAVPSPARWSVAPAPHRPLDAGGTLDVIATSSQVPCLSNADVQIGNAQPVPLGIKRLDDRRVELQASLQNAPPGRAQIHFYQEDPLHHAQIEGAVTIAVEPAPARITPESAPVASLGDRFISLQGRGFESTAALRVAGVRYVKSRGSTSTSACFTGPPIAGPGFEPGESVPAQLLGPNDAAGEAFALTLGATRPALQPVSIVPNAPVHFSTDTVHLHLRLQTGTLPLRPEVHLRRARPPATPCDAVRTDAADAVVPQAATHEVTGSDLEVILRFGDALGDRAFGTVQVQLADAGTTTASAWEDVPGDFVRAPSVARIDCPADPAAPCTLIGTGLAAIDGVEDATGRFVPPDFDCATKEKNLACIRVPHGSRYTLRLGDRETTLTLPDTLVTQPNGVAAP